MREKLAVAALAVILVLVNWSIAGKERHLADGQIVYLELAPVDPRSLMQGDYMALQFQLANEIHDALPKDPDAVDWRHAIDASDGFAVVAVDHRSVGTFQRIDDGRPLAGNEVRMHYRVRAGRVKLATNAWFFQEGHAEIYQPARFGQFRVDERGELLLAGMYDGELGRLGQPPE